MHGMAQHMHHAPHSRQDLVQHNIAAKLRVALDGQHPPLERPHLVRGRGGAAEKQRVGGQLEHLVAMGLHQAHAGAC